MRRALPPLRVTLPLALLVFAVTVGLYDLRQNSRITIQRIEAYTAQELAQRLGEKQSHLELLLLLRQLDQVQAEIASMGADPHLKTALLIDELGTVVGSTRYTELDKPGRTLHPELFTGDAERRMAEARQHLAASVRVTPGGEALVGYYPVLGPPHPGKLTPSTVWLLVVERDLTVIKGQGLRQVQLGVLKRGLLLGTLAGMIWLFFHFVLTRRVKRLVAATGRFAARDWGARCALGGRDELAQVGQAFDKMAEQLCETQSWLEEREARIRLLLDSVAEGIYGLDLEGRSTFVNRAAARLLGYTDQSMLLGLDAHEGWHHSHADGTPYSRSECPILQALKSGTESHVAGDVLWRQDGTGLQVEHWCYPMRQGGRIVGSVTTFVDITERKQAEDMQRFLLQASTQLAELLDVKGTLERVARLAVPQLGQWCVIDMLDDAGRLQRVAQVHQAPAGQHLLRELWQHSSSGGPTFQVMSTGRRLLPDEATRALRQAGDGDAEVPLLLRRLGLRTALALPLSVRGKTLAAMLLVSDTPGFQYGAHELALAEELARRASIAMDNAQLYRQSQQAVRLREDFLSVASHELHTPLTPLRLQLQMLRRALASGCHDESRLQLTEKVDKALGQVARLSRLVDDLLDVSRLTAGRLSLQREEVDLGELTRDLVQGFSEKARAAGCPLIVTIENATRGYWDRMHLEQILTNLLSNALKYGVGRPLEIHAGSSDGWARWSLRDHGIGIAPEDLERIFGRFERAVSTRKYGGLGLGLFISREIARAHGGDIRVESRLGAGALFTVELPLGTTQPSQEGPAQEARAPSPSAARPTSPSRMGSPPTGYLRH
jgi:PAS domain S-box-containing protein